MLLRRQKFYFVHFIFPSFKHNLYGSNKNLFSLAANLKLKMHKNALAAEALPQNLLGGLNYNVTQTYGFWEILVNGKKKGGGEKRKGGKKKRRKKGKREENR